MSKISIDDKNIMDALSSALNFLNIYKKYSEKYPELTAKSEYFTYLVTQARTQIEDAHDTHLLKLLGVK